MMSTVQALSESPAPVDEVLVDVPVSQRIPLLPEQVLVVGESESSWASCVEAFHASATPVAAIVQIPLESSFELAGRVEARVDELVRGDHPVGTLMLVLGPAALGREDRRRALRAVVWSAIRVGVRRVVLNRSHESSEALASLVDELRGLTERMGVRFEVSDDLEL